MKRLTQLSTIAVAAALSFGCAKSDETSPTATKPAEPTETEEQPVIDVNEEASERELQETERGLERTGENVEGEPDQVERQWVESARDSLRSLEEKGAELRQEINQAGERVSAETRQELDELESERQELSQKLERAEQQSESRWDDFKRDVNSGVERLESGYNQLLEKMKTEE